MALLLLPALSLLILSCDKKTNRENRTETSAQESLGQDSPAFSLPGFDPGAHQSPINIFTKKTKEDDEDQHQFVVHFQPLLKTWGTRDSLILNRVVPLSLAASLISLNKCTSIRHRNILLMASLFQWNCTLSA